MSLFKPYLAVLSTLFSFISLDANAQQAVSSLSPANDVVAIARGDAQSEELKHLIVTGYVVPRVGDGPAPVTSLDKDYAQRRGATTVQSVLQSLPQNVGAFTPAVNTGMSPVPGTSSINLRGLGENNTLVLIDGQRQVPFPVAQYRTSNFVDINAVPLAAVDRIEILRDGASATYGADAIAGVVNIILKDEYNGADLYTHYGITQRGDGAEYRASLTGGIASKLWNDRSKVSIISALDYYELDPIKARDRDFSLNPDHSSRGYNDLRSPYGNRLQTIDPSTGNFVLGRPGLNGIGVKPSDFVQGSPDSMTPFYNYAPYTSLIPREERIGNFTKVKFEPTNFLRFYDSFLYQHQEENTQAVPSPMRSSDGLVVPTNNPYNPYGQDVPLSYRALEAGPWQDTIIIDTIRNIFGAQLFNLPNNWFIDASYLYAKSNLDRKGRNYLSKSRLQDVLGGSAMGLVGQYYNPFLDNSIYRDATNRALINSAKIPIFNRSWSSLAIWRLKMGGELFSLPSGAMTLGLGLEYRDDKIINRKDIYSQNNDVASYATGSSNGQRWVRSGYYELAMPILGNKWSFSGARLFEVVIAQRYDEYSDFGSAAKPKFSFRYKPLDDFTIRGSYSEGYRAPSIAELFSGQIKSFQLGTGLVDPKTGSAISPLVISGSNPNLKPELAYSCYLGGVWTPGSKDPAHSPVGFLNGLNVYVDYYNIEKRNNIAIVNPQFILNHESLFPGAVVRNSGGAVQTINDTFQNIGRLETEGFDFGLAYSTKEFVWGKIDVEFNGNYIQRYVIQNLPDQPFIVKAGRYTLPVYRHSAQLFYSKTIFEMDTLSTGVTWNYVDSEQDQTPEPSGKVHVIGNWNTFDYQIAYSFGKPEELAPETPRPGYLKDGKRSLGKEAISPRRDKGSSSWRRYLADTRLVFGVNNVFDAMPPFADQIEGYDTRTTNPFGRTFYVEFEKRF
jgi:outer membrane receptor protein involved in Fe transport